MTSSQVMNSLGANMTNWMSSQAANVKTDATDFQNFMKNSQDSLKAQDNKATETVAKTDAKDTKNMDTEKTGTGDDKVTDRDVTRDTKVTDERQPNVEDVETVKETIDKIRDALKEALGITDEQLDNALETLGMNQMALLIPDNMTDIAVEVTGEDSTISLVTNEDLYNTVTELADTVQDLVEDLTKTMNVDPTEFKAAVENAEMIDPETTEITEELPKDDLRGPALNDRTKEPAQKESLEDKITLTEDAPEEAKTKNFTVQTKNEGEAEEDAPEAKTGQETLKEEPEAQDTVKAPTTFVQNLVDKTTEALNAANETTSYTATETQKILDQMTESIKIQNLSENTEVNIRLHPESLGNVNVKITASSEGTMTAQFTAQNESVKAVLESQALVLKESLEAKGISVEAVEVMVGSHEFNEDLSEREDRNDAAPGKRTGVRRLNLNTLTEDDELSEEDNLQKEIMTQNGNTIDYTA